MPRLREMVVPLFLELFFLSISGCYAENVYCTYYRDSNELTCGTVTCETHDPLASISKELAADGLDPKLPRGWYRIGAMTIRHDKTWLNLYRRRALGSGYWDFYTNIPERNCIGGFGLHAGDNISGSVTVKDKRCFDRSNAKAPKRSLMLYSVGSAYSTLVGSVRGCFPIKELISQTLDRIRKTMKKKRRGEATYN